ncbi:chemotaxis protein CheA [Methanococcoides burtonii]|uniref:Chemotaxis protein CheA n=1 Tax=Methanococcoides burtonii (strain DSM 6242 / NBRC 107633 / OCM 468 / ACE-M) TaxID=259564 RepID=Q12YX0_METBU|nr:chemotaxis protein CheA [Methanococcoides burtonii]ABE51356.1 Chemotaxis protein CheA [Methanococcoides burtonii DSM 6242]
METDMDAYKDDFLQEVNEYLEIFNQAFVDLENGDTAALDEIFRVAHTIKGMAGFLGYASLERLCHRMEEVLSGIKCNEITIDGNLIDIMLSTVDRINEMVGKIESEGNDDIKIDDLLSAFEIYKDQEQKEAVNCVPEIIEIQEAEETINCISEECMNCDKKAGEHNLILNVKISPDSDIMELKAILIIESLKEVGSVIKTEPTEEEIDNTFKGSLKAFIQSDAEKVDEVMNKISEIDHFEIISCEQEENKTKCDDSFPENGGSSITESQDKEEHNLILNVIIAHDSDIKELKAILVIESLKEVGQVIKTEPIEEEIDSTFKGSLKAFIRGDAEKVEGVMNKISEIANFEIISCKKEVPETIDSLNLEEMKNISQNENNSLKEDVLNNEDIEEEHEIFGTTIQNNESRMDRFRDKLWKLINIFTRNTNSSVLGVGSNQQEETPVIVAEVFEKQEIIPEIIAEEIEKQDEIPEIMVEEKNQQEVVDFRNTESTQENDTVIQDTTKKGYVGNKRQDTIRVRVSNIDSIMNLVGELVINKGCLLQISQEHKIPELEEATSILDKSITSLQDEVMMIRMVKIEKVFKKFPRMVRDLSRKFGKDIAFEIEGQETELDRTILDEISDPLVHLVRNCVDHGVESPEERAKAGKSKTGHIKLSAKREKNNVIIEIEDDGKGLDLERIKSKALEKGILSLAELDKLGEDEISSLIFTSGLSTKDNATEISGRGVGMDAVKTTVEKLGGKIKIYSKKGKGTKMRINLPPTVAIIKSLIIESGNEIYAIPISNVVEALDVNKDNFKLIRDQPLLYVREKLLPAIRLKEFFDIGEHVTQLEKEVGIIVERENEEVALLVDSIIDQQEIVIKPLGSILSKVKGFIGVTILGDGKVIPILDVSALVGGDIDA